jgi:hypothetical protein
MSFKQEETIRLEKTSGEIDSATHARHWIHTQLLHPHTFFVDGGQEKMSHDGWVCVLA